MNACIDKVQLKHPSTLRWCLVVLFLLIFTTGCETKISEENEENASIFIPESTLSEYFPTSPKDGMELVYVPAGNFIMGLNGLPMDQEPEHEVYLDAYWIDRSEVTNAMYRLCVQAKVCSSPDWDKYYPYEQFQEYPVVYISWTQAREYCEWAGRRLPTEAEWEKAARGTDARIYPWGNNEPTSDLLNFARINGDIMAVNSYPQGVSPYGVMDMAGNAWEWVADWYDAHYYSISPQDNPTGPDSGDYHVCRGGGWIDYKGAVQTVQRGSSICTIKLPGIASYWYRRDVVDNDLGIRCAMDETE